MPSLASRVATLPRHAAHLAYPKLPKSTNFSRLNLSTPSPNDKSPVHEHQSVKMAPVKKSKKDANSINSKLALVMKSGKGTRCCFLAHIRINR